MVSPAFGVVLVGNDLYVANTDAIVKYPYNDLKEERDVAIYNTWVAEPMLKIIGNLEASLQKYPPIKLGTPDPYTPAQ